jgi:hypothetical protein
MSDLNPWMIEKFKAQMVKTKAKSTVNKYLSLGSQIYEKGARFQNRPPLGFALCNNTGKM